VREREREREGERGREREREREMRRSARARGCLGHEAVEVGPKLLGEVLAESVERDARAALHRHVGRGEGLEDPGKHRLVVLDDLRLEGREGPRTGVTLGFPAASFRLSGHGVRLSALPKHRVA
jgi:hypothetical protein